MFKGFDIHRHVLTSKPCVVYIDRHDGKDPTDYRKFLKRTGHTSQTCFEELIGNL